MRNVLFFGGSGGIGQRLQESLHSVDGKFVSLSSSQCNVRDEVAVRSVMDENPPGVIIYLSGVNSDGLIHKQNWGQVYNQVQVNAVGFVNVLRHATPFMREERFGRVIYISSVLSNKSIPGTGIYSATKAFGDSIVKTYALENAKYGITANSIQLGYFEGGLTEKVPEKIMKSVLEKVPAKRLGTGLELADLVTYLVDNPFMNGANIPLTSGLENV
jgi:NAD(P)-dependent dehydrogenase (short-subunit alcohol dehydrogenase family)